MPDYDIVQQANGNFTVYERGRWDNGDDGGCFKLLKWGVIALFVYVIFIRIKKISTAPIGWQIAFCVPAAVAVLAILIFAIFGIVAFFVRRKLKVLCKNQKSNQAGITSCRKTLDLANTISKITLLTFIVSAVIWVIITLIIAIWVFQ